MPESLDELVKWVQSAAGSPLQRLELAVSTSAEMETVADQLVSHFVDECRRQGIPWSHIGEKLGVSKQAAQQRFVPKGAPAMFERFTDRARAALVNAQEEARLLRHNYLGTEHILLALFVDPESIGAKALSNLGLTQEKVRARVSEIIGLGTTEPSGPPPFTPRAKKALELGFNEALKLGHSYIGTEHILLGLIVLGNGVAADILNSEGATYDKVRAELLSQLKALRPKAVVREVRRGPRKRSKAKKKAVKPRPGTTQTARRRRKS